MVIKKSFMELQFADAFMFAAAMEDEEICRGVLECVLSLPIKRVKIRTEASPLVNPDFRGVRLDVYADDEQETVYDIEMQTTDKQNLPKRSRVYQGQMDMAALKPGENFNKLPASFVIFICTFDPFGQKKYRYTFRETCRETGQELDDGAYKVFLSTKGENNEEVPCQLVRFLKYAEDSSYAITEQADPLVQKIDSRITALKRSRGMEVQYMLFSEMLEDERIEGKEEGRLEERNRLFQLMDLMESGGDTHKIPLIRKNPDLLQRMYQKYHMGA